MVHFQILKFTWLSNFCDWIVHVLKSLRFHVEVINQSCITDAHCPEVPLSTSCPSSMELHMQFASSYGLKMQDVSAADLHLSSRISIRPVRRANEVLRPSEMLPQLMRQEIAGSTDYQSSKNLEPS